MFFFCLRVSYQYREYRINDFHNRYLWSKEFVNDILFIVVYDMTYKFVLHWDRLVLFFFWSEYRINDFIISIYGVKHSQEIFSFSVYMILYDIFYFETGKKKTIILQSDLQRWYLCEWLGFIYRTEKKIISQTLTFNVNMLLYMLCNCIFWRYFIQKLDMKSGL